MSSVPKEEREQTNIQFGITLRMIRENLLGISKDELGAKLGLSGSAVENWETGANALTKQNWNNLKSLLETTFTGQGKLDLNGILSCQLYNDVANFNRKVIGTALPKKLTMLNGERLAFARTVLNEEVGELMLAHKNKDVYGCIDAMIDTIYYALGRIYEMGVTENGFVHMWNLVHNKNMQKQKGNKGRGSDNDAIKPEGWLEPDYTTLVDEAKKQKEREITISAWGMQVPKAFLEVMNIRKKKGEDYRSGTVVMKDYFPFGLKSYQTMIHTKSLRLVSLLQSGKAPNHESVRDSLVDIINYACFAIEAIDKGEINEV